MNTVAERKASLPILMGYDYRNISNKGEVSHVKLDLPEIVPDTHIVRNHHMITFGRLASIIMNEISKLVDVIDSHVIIAKNLAINASLEEVERCLGLIPCTTNNLASICSGLLKYANGDNIGHPNTRISLRKVIFDTVNIINLSFHKTVNVEIKDSCSEGGEVFINGNEAQIQQVLINLIHNAEKSLVGSVGKIIIYIHEVRRAMDENLVPGSTEKGKYIAFSVQDTGRGIKKETLLRIASAEYSEDEMKASRCVGLFLAKSFIKFHSGHMTVKTAEGAGSTFTVYLPRFA